MLHHVGAKAGQRYYDLGSGMGKTTALAWLMGLDATGVELATPRWQTSCAALGRLRALRNSSNSSLPGLRYIHASFTEIDFSDADIVFTDSMMFTPEMLE